MAPCLPVAVHAQVEHMIDAGFGDTTIHKVVPISRNGVGRMRYNLQTYGRTTAPRNRRGRHRSVTQDMRDALLEYLRIWPDRTLQDQVEYLADTFDVAVSASTVSRELKRVRWSKKNNRRIAQQRDTDLQDAFLHMMAPMECRQLVFVDETGCAPRDGFRPQGWAPIGTTPVQVARFQRAQRYHILPAYTDEGVIYFEVYKGTTNAAVFERFIERLLTHCRPWPEPRSVLVMDNASFHHSERVKKMCCDAGVKIVYLPPYSPHLNPIEEFFAELKAFLKSQWTAYNGTTDREFTAFLEWCVERVGQKQDSAKGHFRNAGYVDRETVYKGADAGEAV